MITSPDDPDFYDEDDGDDPHTACRWCGEEHPIDVLDDDLCPGCVDVADEGEA